MRNVKSWIWIIAICAILMPTTVFASSGSGDHFVLGGIYVLQSGQTLDGNLIVIGGTASIEAGAEVSGSVFMVGGTLNVSGTINGNIRLYGGTASLLNTAVVKGNILTTSGQLNKSDQAVVQGQITENPNLGYGFTIPNQVKPVQPAAPVIKTNPVFQFFSTILSIFFQSIVCAILAMLIALFIPRAMDRVADAVVHNALYSGGIGLLTVVVLPIIVVLLTITLVLIPVSLVIILGFAVAVFLGWIVVGYELGNRIAQLFKTKWHQAVAAGIGTLILTLILLTIGKIPCIGWIPIFLVCILGLGGVILTSFGSRMFINLPSNTTSKPPQQV
jgi:hypothetical protein